MDSGARGIFSSPGSDGAAVAVKICGITTASQAHAIADLGVEAIGVNFWPRSKRYIALQRCRDWLLDLKGETIRIAVVVNEEIGEMERMLESEAVDWIQLHGDESSEQLEALLARGWPVFKACGVKGATMLEACSHFPGDSLLLDAYAPNEYGGSGETMDWSLGARAVETWPDREIILAGGLAADNVAKAIREVRPRAVDVASGVEESPGVKDLDLVKRFVENARSVRLTKE